MICNLSKSMFHIQDLLWFLEETAEDAGDWLEQFAVGLGALSNAKNRLQRIDLTSHVLAVRYRHRLQRVDTH